MKRSVARKWVKALESGEYRQVKGALKDKVGNKKCGYCCLGVLCDIYSEETGKGKFKVGRNADDRAFVLKDGTRESGSLPAAVREWAGMTDSAGKLAETVEVQNEFGDTVFGRTLIDLNDDLNFNFKKIAKVIRKQFPTL